MTFTEEETFEDAGFEDAPDYPVAFGITFTPQVTGVAIAVAGLAIAAYILMTFVQPAWENYQSLRGNISEKEDQVANRQAIQNQIQQVQQQLEETQAKQEQVLALFTDEKELDTLLLDLNRSVEAREGQLISYTPQGEITIVDDGSFGTAVNGKLKRQSINIEIEGTYNETRAILQRLEELQSLLLVDNLTSEVREPLTVVYSNGNVALGDPPTLSTTFQINALLPLSEEEKTALAAQQAAEGEQAQ